MCVRVFMWVCARTTIRLFPWTRERSDFGMKWTYWQNVKCPVNTYLFGNYITFSSIFSKHFFYHFSILWTFVENNKIYKFNKCENQSSASELISHIFPKWTMHSLQKQNQKITLSLSLSLPYFALFFSLSHTHSLSLSLPFSFSLSSSFSLSPLPTCLQTPPPPNSTSLSPPPPSLFLSPILITTITQKKKIRKKKKKKKI